MTIYNQAINVIVYFNPVLQLLQIYYEQIIL